jgi:hypothetical protein
MDNQPLLQSDIVDTSQNPLQRHGSISDVEG